MHTRVRACARACTHTHTLIMRYSNPLPQEQKTLTTSPESFWAQFDGQHSLQKKFLVFAVAHANSAILPEMYNDSKESHKYTQREMSTEKLGTEAPLS